MILRSYRQKVGCFNPCFSGFGVIISVLVFSVGLLFGFNPCFSGFGVIIA